MEFKVVNRQEFWWRILHIRGTPAEQLTPQASSMSRVNALALGESIKGLGVKAKRPPSVIVDGSPLIFAGSGDEPDDSESASEPTTVPAS